ncbi:hypothetical protein [Thiobacillus sp.]
MEAEFFSIESRPNVNNAESAKAEVELNLHHDAVEAHHRFENIQFNGVLWDLAHLEAFAFRLDPGLGFEIDVVVLFSCHCFSHSLHMDSRPEHRIPEVEFFDNGRERRVLNDERYQLSRLYLRKLIRELPQRRIQVAGTEAQNFMTFEFIDAAQTSKRYAVFFEVERDTRRKKRVLLRVQSAYILETLTHRQQKAGKVSFNALLKAAYEGRSIRG